MAGRPAYCVQFTRLCTIVTAELKEHLVRRKALEGAMLERHTRRLAGFFGSLNLANPWPNTPALMISTFSLSSNSGAGGGGGNKGESFESAGEGESSESDGEGERS